MNNNEQPKATFIAYDNLEVKRYSKALDLALFVFSLSQLRRTIEKYEDWDDQKQAGADEVFDRISGLLNQYNIVVEDILE